MPTSDSTYDLLAWAIENRVPICCDYGGQRREICPIILGLGGRGEEVLLAYQVGGETSRGPVRRPAWKCFRVSKLSRLEPVEGAWQAGASHSQSQSCVRDVDYDVNEDSPYEPRRSLGDLRGQPR